MSLIIRQDAFYMWLAYAEAIDAAGFAMDLQEALLEVEWPVEILQSPHANLVAAAFGQPIFKGLCVRLAIHTGIPTSIQVCQSPAVAMLLWGIGCIT